MADPNQAKIDTLKAELESLTAARQLRAEIEQLEKQRTSLQGGSAAFQLGEQAVAPVAGRLERQAQVGRGLLAVSMPDPRLIRQLRGRLPSDGSDFDPNVLDVAVRGLPDPQLSKVKESLLRVDENRNMAYTQLQQQGFNDKQIRKAMAVEDEQSVVQARQANRQLPRYALGALAGTAAAILTGGPDPTDVALVPAIMRTLAPPLATGAGAGAGELIGQRISNEPIDLKRAGKIAGIDALVDLGAWAAFKVVGKGLSPFKANIIPEALEFEKDYARVGGRLTPAQLTSGGMLDTIETISESAPIGRATIRDFKKVIQPEKFRVWQQMKLDEIAEGVMRLPPSELQPIVADAILGPKGTLTLAKIQNRQNYAVVDDLLRTKAKQLTRTKRVSSKILDTAGKPLTREVTEQLPLGARDIRPLKKHMSKLLAESEKIGKQEFSPALKSIMEQTVNNTDDFLSYERLAALRSSWISEKPGLQFIRDKSLGTLDDFIGRASDILMDTKGLPEEVVKAARHANRFYAEQFGTGKGLLKAPGRFQTEAAKKILKTLAKNQPEKLSQIAFTPRGATTLRAVKDVVDEKTFLQLRADWLDRMAEKASRNGMVTPGTYMHNLQIMGPEMLQEMFPDPAHLKAVYEIGVGSDIIQRATGGAGQLAAAQAQAVAGFSIASGVATKSPRKLITALSTLFAPRIYAGIVNSPRLSRLLVNGIEVGLGTRQGMSILSRVLVGAEMERMEQQKKLFIEN